MRKVILFMVMSLDGQICGPNGELDWEVRDENVSKYLIPELLKTTDTMLLGRVLYQGFEQAWPAIAKDEKSSKDLVDFANWIENTQKVVFSRNLKTVEWKSSRLVNIIGDSDIAKKVERLKHEDGGDMVVFGGALTAQTFVKLGLVDEYWIKLQPIALGTGRSLFKELKERMKLHLFDSNVFPSGVAVLKYKPLT